MTNPGWTVRGAAIAAILAFSFVCTGCSDDDSAGSECGNGIVEGEEQCDDGNDVDTDWCSNLCQIRRPRWLRTIFWLTGAAASGAAVGVYMKFIYVPPTPEQLRERSISRSFC